MGILYLWYYYLIIGTILLIGKAIACRLLGLYHTHYQIGYSPSLFKFQLYDVTFSIGIIIPIPWLFKIYEVHNNEKSKPIPIWIRREYSFLKRFGGIMGGITLLYLFATILYAINYYTTEYTYLSADNINESGLYVDSLGYELGFRTGDKVVEIEGNSFEKYTDIAKALLLDNARHFTIIRNDSIQQIVIDNEEAIRKIVFSRGQVFYPIIAKFPLKIESVIDNSYASEAGLNKGDKIISVNQDTILTFRDFSSAMKINSNNSVVLGINKNGSNELIFHKVRADQNGKIGITINQTLSYSVEKKNFLQSINAGNSFIYNYIKQIKILFANEAHSKQIGGFQSMGKLFPEPIPFWRLLSIVLLTYICLFIIPTPITDARFLIALIIDQWIKIPRSAAIWIGWIVFFPLLILANIIDIIKAF